jgi:hypothetical protein
VAGVAAGRDASGEFGGQAGLGTLGAVQAAGQVGDQREHLGSVQPAEPERRLVKRLGLGHRAGKRCVAAWQVSVEPLHE